MKCNTHILSNRPLKTEVEEYYTYKYLPMLRRIVPYSSLWSMKSYDSYGNSLIYWDKWNIIEDLTRATRDSNIISNHHSMIIFTGHWSDNWSHFCFFHMGLAVFCNNRGYTGMGAFAICLLDQRAYRLTSSSRRKRTKRTSRMGHLLNTRVFTVSRQRDERMLWKCSP